MNEELNQEINTNNESSPDTLSNPPSNPSALQEGINIKEIQKLEKLEKSSENLDYPSLRKVIVEGLGFTGQYSSLEAQKKLGEKFDSMADSTLKEKFKSFAKEDLEKVSAFTADAIKVYEKQRKLIEEESHRENLNELHSDVQKKLGEDGMDLLKELDARMGDLMGFDTRVLNGMNKDDYVYAVKKLAKLLDSPIGAQPNTSTFSRFSSPSYKKSGLDTASFA